MKIALLAFALLTAVPVAAADPIAAALAAPGRPADDVALDAGRKPGEVLALAGLKPGDRVLDMMAGKGYYTRLAAAIVGPTGSVVALNPASFMKQPEFVQTWDALKAANPNVAVIASGSGAPLPADLDLILFHLTYHDLYWESAKYGIVRQEPAKILAALYAATKPGGQVLVVDHVGPAGIDPRVEADKTHRIDPAVVAKDFAAAGFKLVKQSDLLRNPADDHSKLVFLPEIRGNTDRMTWLFQKPKG